MNNCFTCSIKDECEASKFLFQLKEFFPYELCNQIEDIIREQFNCEYYEN